MNNSNSKLDRFNNGFSTRIQQLIIKQAALEIIEKDETLSKQASAFSAAFRRIAPSLGQAAERVPFTSRLAGGAGSAVGKLMATPARAVRAIVNPNRPAGAISHMVGGMGEGFMSGFGPRGRAMGKSFRDFVTRPVRFGQGAGQTMADAMQARNPITGASPEFAQAFRGSHPGAIPPSPTPFTPEAMRGSGMVAPHSTPNWTHGGGAAGEFGPTEMRGARFQAGGGGAAGAAAGAGGDPTGGLMDKMRGLIPPRYQDWMNQHPQLSSGLLGAGIGGGTVYGADAYGDYKRRQALANAGIMERLALAFQLATNPQGFSNTLRL